MSIADSRAPVRKSLLRRITWFGGDRRWVGGWGLALVMLGVTMFRGLGIYYGVPIVVPGLLWVALIWIGREMNKADPYMLDVLMRQFKYRRWYAAKSDLGIEHPQVRDYR